jgi:hypothetical protein
MKSMRFSLSKLFLAVAMAALACAGMLSPTRLWATSITSLTIAVFAVTAIRAIGLHGRERVFAITFALIGSGYLLLVVARVDETLITNYPLALLADVRQVSRSETLPNPPTNAGGFYWTAMTSNGGAQIVQFFRVGHCVWSWLLAFFAAWFASHVYAKAQKLQKT